MYANVVTTRQRLPCSGSNAGSSLPEAAAIIARSGLGRHIMMVGFGALGGSATIV
jgi:hypothetical protein